MYGKPLYRFIGFSLLTGLPHVETIGYNAEIVPMFHGFLPGTWLATSQSATESSFFRSLTQAGPGAFSSCRLRCKMLQNFTCFIRSGTAGEAPPRGSAACGSKRQEPQKTSCSGGSSVRSWRWFRALPQQHLAEHQGTGTGAQPWQFDELDHQLELHIIPVCTPTWGTVLEKNWSKIMTPNLWERF